MNLRKYIQGVINPSDKYWEVWELDENEQEVRLLALLLADSGKAAAVKVCTVYSVEDVRVYPLKISEKEGR